MYLCSSFQKNWSYILHFNLSCKVLKMTLYPKLKKTWFHIFSSLDLMPFKFMKYFFHLCVLTLEHPIIDAYATIMNCRSSNIRPQNLILECYYKYTYYHYISLYNSTSTCSHVLTINSSYFHVYDINSRAIASDH